MAKPVLKFTAVPYEIGNHTGYRPQLEQQKPVSDLDFCREVVTEKRLSMSAEELLHALEMVGEVGPQKVAEDGRPRAVTKLLKWNRYAQGKLESPTSPWNGTCRAVIRAQLLFDAEKLIDASFQNVNSGVGVRLDNVTWIGAKSVQNVIKIGADFAAYGRHMEFIADGEKPDTAWLELENGETFDLANKASDVSSATFGFPAALAGVEPGTQVTFWMKSRGGVADGQVYTSKKVVTVLAGDPTPPPTVDHAYSDGDGSTDNWAVGATDGYLTGGAAGAPSRGTPFESRTQFCCRGPRLTHPCNPCNPWLHGSAVRDFSNKRSGDRFHERKFRRLRRNKIAPQNESPKEQDLVTT